MIVIFAQASEAGPTDPFLSRRPFGNYSRLNMTAKMLRDAIKKVATRMPNRNPLRYSPKSFKMAGITWMISAGVSQADVNKAADHSQKGSSSYHYQDVRVTINPLAVAGDTTFGQGGVFPGDAFRGGNSSSNKGK